MLLITIVHEVTLILMAKLIVFLNSSILADEYFLQIRNVHTQFTAVGGGAAPPNRLVLLMLR